MKGKEDSIIEIPAACNRLLMTGYFLMSGVAGFVMIKIGSTPSVVFGIIFAALSILIGWQVLSHPRWRINLETGQLRLIRAVRFPQLSNQDRPPLSVKSYTRLHLRMRTHPASMWTVVMSDMHGKELLVAPCVSRERGEEIARLLSEKFGLKNDAALG